MLPDMHPTLLHLELVERICRAADPLMAARMGKLQPFVCISPLLTLFAHDVQDPKDIRVVFDYILASDNYACIYLAASHILTRRRDVLESEEEEEEMVQVMLSKAPPDVHVQSLLLTADMLRRDLHGKVVSWATVTASSALRVQTVRIRVAEEAFERQMDEMPKGATLLSWQIAGSVLLGGIGVAFALYTRS